MSLIPTETTPKPGRRHGLITDENRRWWTLGAMCFALFMIMLDNTVVNVALPSIREDLHFTETSLVWVVNAYLLTFGGFLLLGGRLGDLFGHRRVFLLGLAVFTVASLACGIANTQGLLIAARAVQGLGGAVVSAVALSLIMNVFPDATMIVTHRDPVDVSVSMATMMTYTMRMSVDVVDVPTVANYWIGRIEEMLNCCMRDHDKLPPERTIDVRFDEFMADDLAMVQRVWDVAGYAPSEESRQAVVGYLAGHARGRLGTVDYRPEDLGLDRDDLRRRFAPYVERFVTSAG